MDFNIKPLGVNIEQFRNNPKLQIEAAAKLAEQFKSQFTEEDRRLAKEKGYNENALLAGAWLGGVGGVRKVLRGEGNPSDKHWSKEGKGTTVKDRMDKFNKMEKGGVLKYEDGNKVDPAILEYWKKQNVVLPSPKNEQISADNRTKELRNYQEAQQQVNQNLEKGKHLNFWTQPYADFDGRQAAELGSNLFKQSIYAGAGEVAGTYALQGLSKLSKFIPKRKVVKPIETKVGPKTYEELKTPDVRTLQEHNALSMYKTTSDGFKQDYSTIDNFYKDFVKDPQITVDQLLSPKFSTYKMSADKAFKINKPLNEALEEVTKRTKGDELKLVRHTNEPLPIGEYEPKRPLSFSFPNGQSHFGNNRLIVDIPKEQSYLAIEKIVPTGESEVLLPRKLKFQVTKSKKPNEFGGDDYIGKILNPYLMPLITKPLNKHE